ncbi:J-type co-chaperone JAC1 [Paramyrothecium foliicola]|nr:J-type co-chaperone JAC1 [Paramyrothecium foliicola]
MRASVASAGRDAAARLCTRCRLRAQRAFSTARAAEPRAHMQALSRCTDTLRAQQRRPFSQSFRVAAPAASASDAAATSTSPADSTAAPPPPRTHYDLFPQTLSAGPPPSGHFPVDVRALRREFLQLQARAHPDLHPPEHKARAEATSALINEAYRTLSNPLLRAQYLLSLRGVDVANDETLKIEEPDLLMEVLESREDIEAATDEAELDEPRRVNDDRIAASEAELERAFRTDDVDAAKREAVRLRYWINIKESLDNWEPGKPVVLQH